MHIFDMEIIESKGDVYKLSLRNDNEEVIITFNPFTKNLEFISYNELTEFFKFHQYQIRKILHNKRIETYYDGFFLKFVLRSDKDVAAFNDKNKIVVLDKRKGLYESYAIDEKMGEIIIHKVFTDASYFKKNGKSGIAFIVEDLNGDYSLHTEKIDVCGSSQAELRAVTEALKLLKDIEKIRIITDSQYVRKGLTEWIPFWKLNDFKTVNGENAKNMDSWIETDRACNGKYIEFQWIKGHSQHFENTLCDMYAKDEGRK